MNTEAISILTDAEYISVNKTGRNVHRVNSLLTQIYLLCSVDRYSEAKKVLQKLQVVIREERPKIPEFWLNALHKKSIERKIRYFNLFE